MYICCRILELKILPRARRKNDHLQNSCLVRVAEHFFLLQSGLKIRLTHLIFCLDVSEIKKDQGRMEHFTSVAIVIKSVLGDSEELTTEYLLELFGKVLSRIFLIKYFIIFLVNYQNECLNYLNFESSRMVVYQWYSRLTIFSIFIFMMKYKFD